MLAWIGAHLSVQLKIKNGKSKSSLTSTHLPATPTAGTPPPATTSRAGGPPRPKFAASRPPELAAQALTAPPHTRRPMVAAPHPHRAARSSSPRYRRSELFAPRRPMVAAPSSSPDGQESGRGGDPPEMGQGEEICWRWSRAGEEIRRRRGTRRWRRGGQPQEEDNTYFFFPFFYWADNWAPVHVSANRIFFDSSALTGGSHLSALVSIRVQLAISANYEKLPKKSWFFVIET
jgi:hypothetical protein